MSLGSITIRVSLVLQEDTLTDVGSECPESIPSFPVGPETCISRQSRKQKETRNPLHWAGGHPGECPAALPVSP